MKIRAWLAAAAIATFAAIASAAEPEIEFSGVLANGKNTQVALRRKDEVPRWVGLGQVFAGYTVTSYDAKEETLVLTKDGVPTKLKLRAAKVANGTSELPPETKRAILNNLRQLAAAADQFYLENGKSTVTLDQLVGTDKYVKRLVPVMGEDYRAIEFAQGKTMRVTTPSGQMVDYAP